MTAVTREPVPIAGPVAQPSKPRHKLPAGTWDAHAHIFGPADKFPYAEGRGYTPPDAPVDKYVALLKHLGCARGLIVQGNAHGYDNRVLLDALTRYPQRFRGVAITDARVKPSTLRYWHQLGMRGLRFHLLKQDYGYIRGAGLDVFETFRKTMGDLHWVLQIYCDSEMLAAAADKLREFSREMPVIVDHMGMVDAARGINEPNFQALLKLVGDGHVHVKVSAAYRLSRQYPDYPDARPFHEALVRANPGRLLWGTDWPHTSIPAEVMPDDGHLLDLFFDWTPDEAVRQKILVATPQRLFGS
jgi:predicted TIM-barrel fold metal-dependent hydrolase